MAVLEIFKQSITISFFVLSMMIFIEVLTIMSKGRFSNVLKKKPFGQIILSAILGIIPGCMGTYAVVSLYTHGTVGFAALITAFIATSGDEAFIMMSMIPGDMLKITSILLIVGIISGFLTYVFIKKRTTPQINPGHIEIHSYDDKCLNFNPKAIFKQLKNISLQRGGLILAVLPVLILLYFGQLGHSHFPKNNFENIHKHEQVQDIHNTEKHEHDESHSEETSWETITFFVIIFIGFIIILLANEHFLSEHLWGHVIKKHLPKLFLWTLGAFSLLYLINYYLDIETWISSNIYWVLFLAVLIGIIPESGPHIIFISMYAAGIIPMSILLANSIVQDGHGSIPLLAESQKSFIKAKIVNLTIGLIVGFVFLFFE